MRLYSSGSKSISRSHATELRRCSRGTHGCADAVTNYEFSYMCGGATVSQNETHSKTAVHDIPPAPPTRSNHRDLDPTSTRPRPDLDPTPRQPQFRTEINRDLTSDPKIPNWFRPPPTRPSRQIQRSAAAVHTQLQSRRGFHTRARVSNGLGFGSRQLDALGI